MGCRGWARREEVLELLAIEERPGLLLRVYQRFDGLE